MFVYSSIMYICFFNFGAKLQHRLELKKRFLFFYELFSHLIF